jgi:hypothetical protein
MLRNGTIAIVVGGATARFWDELSGWPLATLLVLCSVVSQIAM